MHLGPSIKFKNYKHIIFNNGVIEKITTKKVYKELNLVKKISVSLIVKSKIFMQIEQAINNDNYF